MRKVFLLLAGLCLACSFGMAQVAINQNGAAADPSAVLDLQSTEKGLLIPRLSNLERAAITVPATGLLIYNSSENLFQYYDGTQWVDIGSGGTNAGDCIIDVDEDTYVCVDSLTNDIDRIKFAIQDSVRWQMKRFTLESSEDMNGVLIGKGAGAIYNPLQISADDIIAIGDSTLSHTELGGKNLAIGNFALHRNVGGDRNIAIGDRALSGNVGGSDNIAVGWEALRYAPGTFANVAIGSGALSHPDNTGSQNTGVGNRALDENESGSQNTAIGSLALLKNISGGNNVAIGHNASRENLTGNLNIAIGTGALFLGKHRSNIIAIGNSALSSNGLDSFQVNDGTWNTALGFEALRDNNIGRGNTAIGYQTLFNNKWDTQSTCPQDTTGNCSVSDQNTALGARAGYANTRGAANTFLGF